jgi:hypothetical protein
MGMTIDQTRQHGFIIEIDHRGVAGNGGLLHNIFDHIAFNQDGFIQKWMIILSIYKFSAFDGSELGIE